MKQAGISLLFIKNINVLYNFIGAKWVFHYTHLNLYANVFS